MSDTVLAIIELDNFPEAVASRAAWLAKLHGCDLQLLLSDPSFAILRDSFLVSNEAKELAKGIEKAQQQILEQLKTTAVDEQGIDVNTRISHERQAAEAIIEISVDTEPRFVVKGTHYHSPAERATFTYTDWQLIRHLPAPLWLVKPGEWKKHPVLVAAVDPMHEHDPDSDLDHAIVAIAKDLAAKVNGRVELLHTYERLVEIGDYAKFKFKPVKLPIDDLDKNIRDAHRQKLDALAAAHDIAADAVHQMPGRTRDILPTFARANGANLVVMGAIARSGLKQRLLGSTAEQVLDHLPCDILIARSA